MKGSDFDYGLPRELIAQYPPTKRGHTNLLVVDRKTEKFTVKKYYNFVEYLKKGDVLVLNQTKVIPARLHAKTLTGKEVEVFILERHPDSNLDWESNLRTCMIGGARKLKNSKELYFKDELKAELEGRNEDGTYTLRFMKSNGTSMSNQYLEKILTKLGHVSYPPYIKREETKEDAVRYQTIFAAEKGSVAAPTASLNITDTIIEKLESKGVYIAYLTLHVGYGTFKPVSTETVEDHHMHSEWFKLDQENAGIINLAKENRGDVWAVGTTVTRTLEFIFRKITAKNTGNIKLEPQTGEADIYIYPGYKFKFVDHILTNFHAPYSTVLMMIAGFFTSYFLENNGEEKAVEEGRKILFESYNYAKAENFKFLSYGDSMLII